MSENVSPELSSRQRRFVTAMLTASTIEEAAEAAGVCERTGYRYLKDPAVKSEIAEAMATVFEQVAWRVSRAMLEALETLVEINKDPDQSSLTRLSAAKTILDHGPKLREQAELASRLASLEDKLGVG